MFSYLIKHIKPFNKIGKGLFLIILHVGKIPPHIAIIYNEKYYSLSVKGKTLGENFEILYRVIRNKKINTLLFKINSENISEEQILTAFTLYNTLSKNTTCLHPVKALLSKICGNEVLDAKFVFDVLPILYDKGKIENVTHLNLERDIENDDYNFPKYTMEDVIRRIDSYKKEKLC